MIARHSGLLSKVEHDMDSIIESLISFCGSPFCSYLSIIFGVLLLGSEAWQD